MKAIILAAGEGVRMRPLTLDKPKPMIEVLGKPLLQYIFESLPNEIDEVLLVVGYKREQIEQYFGNNYLGRKITYLLQEKKLGTAHALALTKNYLVPDERFLLLYADDIYSKESIERCVTHPLCLLAGEVKDPKRFGVLEIDAQGIIIGLEEKPEKPKSNLVAPGVYVLNTHIFDYVAPLEPNGEYYLTTMLTQMIKDYPIHTEKTDKWISFAFPEDIQKAERQLQHAPQ